jgi:hypothetical protein
MSRKDYELIADIIAQFNRDIANEQFDSQSEAGTLVLAGERAALHTLSHRLADQLRQENPRFDRSRFINACQLDAERIA